MIIYIYIYINIPADREPCSYKQRFSKKTHFPQSETYISASRIVPNSRARIWQNLRFVWVLDSFHWSMLTSLFLSFFSEQEESQGTLTCPPNPTPSWHPTRAIATHVSTFQHCEPFRQCIQRCNTTRHLCSVATCSGRSTRKVITCPPQPHPFMTSDTRNSNTCVDLPALRTISTMYTKMQHYQTASVQRSNMCEPAVATCSGRSTRKVNMPPPTPPLHDIRHAQ